MPAVSKDCSSGGTASEWGLFPVSMTRRTQHTLKYKERKGVPSKEQGLEVKEGRGEKRSSKSKERLGVGIINEDVVDVTSRF